MNNYINRSASSINKYLLSPEDVVRNHLNERKNKDGTISFKSTDVKEVNKSRYVSMMKDSEIWKINGWSEVNIAVLRCYYTAKYDNTKIPFMSRKLCQEFYLSRKGKKSHWQVHDAMTPYDVQN